MGIIKPRICSRFNTEPDMEKVDQVSKIVMPLHLVEQSLFSKVCSTKRDANKGDFHKYLFVGRNANPSPNTYSTNYLCPRYFLHITNMPKRTSKNKKKSARKSSETEVIEDVVTPPKSGSKASLTEDSLPPRTDSVGGQIKLE